MNINEIRSMDYDIVTFFNEVIDNNLFEKITEVERYTFIHRYLEDEIILEMHERYCFENGFFTEIFYPFHTMEDHFGTDVQEYVFNNTDIPSKYQYYTTNGKKSIFYTEDKAIEIARNKIKSLDNDVLIDYFEKA